MRRVLVTGATGFIGRHLVERLATDYSVRCAIRHTDRIPASWSGRFELAVTGPLSPSTDWSAALTDVDAVIHLAALAHGKAAGWNQLESVNVEALRSLAQQAVANSIGRFILVSTIGVFGRSTDGSPFKESSPLAPHDDYSSSKLRAEEALRAVAANTPMEVVVVRPPLVYGPRAPGNFGRLEEWVRRGIPLPLGALQNERSLVSVYNLVDFLTLTVSHPKAAGETFVVSDGEDLSTSDLVRSIADAAGTRARLVSVPPAVLRLALAAIGRGEDYVRLCGSLQVDSSHARNTLGWVPPYPVHEGLRRSVAGAEELRSNDT